MTMSYKYIFTLIYMKRMYLIPLMWNNITNHQNYQYISRLFLVSYILSFHYSRQNSDAVT
mgnify:CR=1 FL=1